MSRFLIEQPDDNAASARTKWDPVLSSTQLTCVGVVGVLAFATLGLYMFYPPPNEILDEVTNIRAELYYAV